MRYLLFIFLFISSLCFGQQPPVNDSCILAASLNDTDKVYYDNTISYCRNTPSINIINEWKSGNLLSYRCYRCSKPCFDTQIYDAATKSCSCPVGTTQNTSYSAGIATVKCLPEGPNPNDTCPSGYPKVNGNCPVCPAGFNPDGSCVGSSCPAGQTTQGYINGYAMCQGSCSDPKQSWGSVNGIEGCYGACSCANGGSYGSVNGVVGCYGGTGSGLPVCGNSGGAGGSAGSNSSGGAGGSSGSNTSGGAGGSSGSNTSGGAGGSSGSGNNGGNNGGGGGSNNSVGEDYPDQVACPEGYVKSGTKCVTENKGDCPANYHQLVISRDPFLFWCVPDDPPQSSSASSQNSSQPSSHSASSQNSSQQSSRASGSSGSNGSSGSGGNNGDGGSGGGSGECDPTSASYLSCIGEGDEFAEGQKGSFDTEIAKQEQQQLEQQIKQKITDIKSQITEQMGGRISGSGSITDYCKIINGVDVCFGFAKFSAYLPLIGQAIFLVACVFSFYVILGR